MAKCEVIDLSLSDSDSDSDFIQAKKAKVEPKSLSPRYRTRACTVVSRSQADSFALREAGSFASRC